MQTIHKVLLFSLILFYTVLLISSCIEAQPQQEALSEPPSPELEWNPKPPTKNVSLSYQLEKVGSGKPPQELRISLVDREGNKRNEIYPTTSFAINFSAPVDEFYIYLYLWYNKTQGREKTYIRCGWVINGSIIRNYAAGDVLRVGWLNISNLLKGECQSTGFGNYVLKMWIYDNRTKKFNSSQPLSFRYLPAPNVTITLMTSYTNIWEDEPLTLNFQLKNVGEESYSYNITTLYMGSVSNSSPGNGSSVPFELKTSETRNFAVNLTPTKNGTLIVEITILAKGIRINSNQSKLDVRAKVASLQLVISEALNVNHTERIRQKLTIRNNGNRNAENIIIHVSKPAIAQVNPSSIEQLKQGTEITINVIIFGLEPGVHDLTINASYQDDKGRLNIAMKTIKITVNPCITINTTLLGINKPCDECIIRVNGVPVKGSGKVCVKYGNSVNLVADNVTKNDLKYIFDSRSLNSSIGKVTESKQFVAYYKVLYYVNVTSEKGNASGTGWYEYGDKVNITVSPIAIGFLLKDVFDHWEVNGNPYNDSPTTTLTVKSPMRIIARWRTDYSETLLLVLVLLAYYLAMQSIPRKTKTKRKEIISETKQNPSI